jgi:hypothetical protein
MGRAEVEQAEISKLKEPSFAPPNYRGYSPAGGFFLRILISTSHFSPCFAQDFVPRSFRSRKFPSVPRRYSDNTIVPPAGAPLDLLPVTIDTTLPLGRNMLVEDYLRPIAVEVGILEEGIP